MVWHMGGGGVFEHVLLLQHLHFNAPDSFLQMHA